MACPSFRRFVASTCWAAILSGCASQQSFRIVDAKSGEPLGDVRVERLEGGYRPSSMPFVVVNALSPVEKQTTNPSGAATFDKSGSKFMVNPARANPDYGDAYVKATWSGATVRYPREYREFSVPRRNGVVEIPLRRRGGGSDASRSDKATAGSPAENHGQSAAGDAAPHDDRSGIVDARQGT